MVHRMLSVLIHHHQILYLNQGLTRLGGILFHIQYHIPSHHQPGNILFRNSLNIMYAHGGPPADNGDPVADLLDLLQLMGNEDDGIAMILQV